MGTLSTFKSKVLSGKLAQQHYFKVRLHNIAVSDGPGNVLQKDEEFDIWVQASQLPSQSLTELEVKKHNISFRMPDRMEWGGEWTCEVLMDMSYTNYQRLLQWQRAYCNLAKDGGGDRGFPAAYAEVLILNNKFEETGPKLKMYGLYPKTVPEIALSQEESAYIKPAVVFGFSYTDGMQNVDPVVG